MHILNNVTAFQGTVLQPHTSPRGRVCLVELLKSHCRFPFCRRGCFFDLWNVLPVYERSTLTLRSLSVPGLVFVLPPFGHMLLTRKSRAHGFRKIYGTPYIFKAVTAVLYRKIDRSIDVINVTTWQEYNKISWQLSTDITSFKTSWHFTVLTGIHSVAVAAL